MSVRDYFSAFGSNLRMDSDTVSAIQNRYHQLTKRRLDEHIEKTLHISFIRVIIPVGTLIHICDTRMIPEILKIIDRNREKNAVFES